MLRWGKKKNVEEKAVVKWLADKQCAKFHNCRNFGSLENGANLDKFAQ
jgi:hypothetical protein